jgi:hypothetical protein
VEVAERQLAEAEVRLACLRQLEAEHAAVKVAREEAREKKAALQALTAGGSRRAGARSVPLTVDVSPGVLLPQMRRRGGAMTTDALQLPGAGGTSPTQARRRGAALELSATGGASPLSVMSNSSASPTLRRRGAAVGIGGSPTAGGGSPLSALAGGASPTLRQRGGTGVASPMLPAIGKSALAGMQAQATKMRSPAAAAARVLQKSRFGGVEDNVNEDRDVLHSKLERAIRIARSYGEEMFDSVSSHDRGITYVDNY